MFQSLLNRWIIIIAIILGSIYFIVPTINYYSITNDPDLQDINVDYLKEDALKLGLDLQGGVYIILELDHHNYLLQQSSLSPSKLKDDLDYLIRSAIEKASLSQIDILDQLQLQASNNQINLKLYYSNLLRNNPQFTDKDIIAILKNNRKESMNDILEIMRNRIESHNQYGMGEPTIQRFGDDRLIIELAGVTDATKAKDYIQRTAEFKLALVHDAAKLGDIIQRIDNNLDDIQLADILSGDGRGNIIGFEKDYNLINQIFKQQQMVFSDKYQILWDDKLSATQNGEFYRTLYLVSAKPAISGGEIQNPKALISEFGNEDVGSWIVNLDMTREGKIKWSRFTGNNIGKRVAIVLDNRVFMAPMIQDQITSGGTRITGFADKQEAQDIAAVLKAGELPAPIKIAQTNYIGPSLGEDSIQSGTSSMLFGLLTVFIFMLIYYSLSGMIANIALLINMIMITSVLITMKAVLTLPGIAGLLLTIGMSVDANIIIFERIREELKLGVNTKSAINVGYNRAFITILDANITTLITAFVLSFIGSGPIKGFATTLSIGILCSMFSAIFVTKTMFLTFITYKPIKKLSI
tara:strand:- start:39327 stop:41069 length:1743 start_codon:yes stop_codon:yes gene_type:complete